MFKRHFASALVALVFCASAVLAGSPDAQAAQPQAAQPRAALLQSTPLHAAQHHVARFGSQMQVVHPQLASSTDLESRVVLDHGHVDAFSVALAGEDVSPAVNEDVTGSHVHRAAEDVLFHVKQEAYTDVTAKIAGIERVGYTLPQTQQADLLWPGWDSMTVADKEPDASVAITIDTLTGPGEVFLWQDSFSGEPQPVTDAGLRLRSGAVISQESPAHVHANWLFTKPGAYQMTVRATVNAGGRALTSKPATLTWIVGDLQAGMSSLNTDSSKEPNASGSDNSGDPEGQSAYGKAGVARLEGSSHDSGAQQGGKPKKEGEAGLSEATGQQAPGRKPDAGAEAGRQTKPPQKSPAQTPTQPGQPAPTVEQCIPTEVSVPAAGSASGSHTIPANTHVHPNWVFSKEGTYRVSLTQTATTKAGKKLSATGTLTFNVGGSGNATSGHFDVGSVVESGQLKMLVKDDRSQPASWRNPSELVFGLSDAARVAAPAGIEFVAPQGAPVWIISSTQMQGVPWVGANTQHPSLSQATTGAVTWTVNSVQGPGAMAVFESGSFGQIVGKRWFGASGDGTAKVFVGKTASGKDCELSPEQIAEIEAAGGVVGGRLATTGSNPVVPWLGAAFSMIVAGALLIRVARPTSPAVS